MKSLRLTLLTLLLSSASVVCNAQFVDTRAKEEKLSLADRISLKTNAIDWLTLTPNLGIEFDVRGTNWNRWAAVVNAKGNFTPSRSFTPRFAFEHQQVRVEARNYWRTRQIDGRYVKFHTNWLDKLFSLRRVRSKHPLTTYYRGLYAAYDKFSMKFKADGEGVRGNAITGGFVYGIVRPLYEYSNGNSVDFELGVAAGVSYVKYDKFKNDYEHNTYVNTSVANKGIYPALTDLHVGFIYRFGKYPVTKKYRYRYDVDYDFQGIKDSIEIAKANAIAEETRLDTLNTSLEHKFWSNYYDNTDNDLLNGIDTVGMSSKKIQKLIEKKKKANKKEIRAVEKRMEREQKKAAKEAAKEAERVKAINNAKRRK